MGLAVVENLEATAEKLTWVRLVSGQVADVVADVLGKGQELLIVGLENRRHACSLLDEDVDELQNAERPVRKWSALR